MENPAREKRYDILCPTSMGVRITPTDRQSVHTAREYRMQATSAESNVLAIGASLGLRTKVLTAFVSGSPIADFIKRELSFRHIEYEGPEVPQDGPWGARHQFNIADSGFGLRGPRVWNDRAGEVGRSLSAGDFDLARIFARDGARLLHLSGLIAAISPDTAGLCLDLARHAKDNGTLVSFDLNHRASFWKGREAALRDRFTEIARLSDILIGNEEDFQLALGLRGPESGGVGLAGKIEAFKGMIDSARQAFPDVGAFATTLREVVSANEHLWGAILWADGRFHVIEPRPIPVLDRIGGGDAFVGGLLYGVIRGWTPEKWAQFGWASGALVASLESDFGCPADEGQIWDIWKGNARVKR